jgi:hypothetical protein
MHKSTIMIIAAMATLSIAPAQAQDRTVLEQMIVEQNPCSGLSTDVGGVTIGVDQLRDVTVDAVDLSLRGDDLTMSLAGNVTCATPDDALLGGDASAAIAASATVNLAQCDMRDLSVTLDDIGGTYGPVLMALRGQIEQALSERIRDRLVSSCQRMMADAGEQADAITVTGTISDGVECPIIETDGGEIYALSGNVELPLGQRVEVRGTLAEMSFCMQGQGTIEVAEFGAMR